MNFMQLESAIAEAFTNIMISYVDVFCILRRGLTLNELDGGLCVTIITRSGRFDAEVSQYCGKMRNCLVEFRKCDILGLCGAERND